MDAKYLDSTVADALVQGLSQVVVSQADDPVDYLGQFLLKYVESARLKEQMELEDKQEESDKKAEAERLNKLKKEREPVEKAAAERKSEDEAVTKLLESCKDIEEVYEKLLNVIVRETNATAAQIIKKEGEVPAGDGEEEEEAEDGPKATITYLAATKANEFLLDKKLQAPWGVSWDAFKRPPAPEPEEPEGDEEDEDAPKPEVPLPELPTLLVDNVLLEPRTRFFDLPRPGQYLVVPVEYKSALHGDAFPPEPEPEEGEKEEGENEEEGEEGEEGKEGKEEGEEAKEPPAPVEKPPPEPKTILRQLGICVDKLGQAGERLSPAQVEAVKAWGKRLAAALERSEKQKFVEDWKLNQQLKTATEEVNKALEADKEEAEKRLEENTKAALEPLGEEPAEEVKALAEKEVKLKEAAHKVELTKAALELFARRNIPVTGAPLKVFEATLLQLRHAPEEFGERSDSSIVSWPRMRALIGSSLFKEINEFDAAKDTPLPSDRSSVESIQQLLEGAPAEDLAAVSPGFTALLEWNQAALEVRQAAAAKRQYDQEQEEKRKAEEEAAKAAAEEGGEEGEGEGDGDE